MRQRARNAEAKVKNLERKMEVCMQKCGQTLDDELHNDFVNVLKERSSKIDQVYPDQSFANLFWKE